MRNGRTAVFTVMAMIGLGGLAAAPLAAQEARKPWADVAAPAFVSVGPKAGSPGRIAVVFTLATGTDGADKAAVDMLDAAGAVLETKPVGRSKNDIKTVEFVPKGSGNYAFRVSASRNDVVDTKFSETLRYAYSLPLAAPIFRVLNRGQGKAALDWNAVAEAESYEVSYTDPAGRTILAATIGVAADRTGGAAGTAAAPLKAEISGLTIGAKYSFVVAAVRGADRTTATAVVKTVRAAADREWAFTWFGQSSNAELNTLKMIDADDLKFQLNSCSVLPDGNINLKGGKFTAFHDGVSFYYTRIDAAKENFVLSATFTIDFINPTADGQEGFGLLAMDSLGAHGVSMVNHYTNSAGIIATKFEETIGGVKKTSKDTLGARFVTGITKEVLAQGDSGIAQNGRSVSHAYSYDSTDLVKAGDVFRLTLKKTNTGYHAILEDENAPDDAVLEYILYGPEKLLQLDKDHVYVGFAVARGCNATVSDVSMTITDPAADPSAEEEPPELIPLQAKIDSPTTFVTADYPFVFIANADGKLTVTDRNRRALVKDETVSADRDFTRNFSLTTGFNDYSIVFTPDPAFKPGEKQAMAAWDKELLKYVASSAPIYLSHSVLYHYYEAPELHVSADGSFMGKGGSADPLDLNTALAFAKPGQEIILSGGIYYPQRALVIPRGVNGTADARRVLKAAPGERPILDFSSASGGMTVWGDYWTIEGIDIRNTPGNVKGLQIAGDYNIINNVTAYNCGDTGIQISGVGAEPFAKWPHDNLVLNCTSYNNCDPAANNADGFAAKLTCGPLNVFRGCVAYSNIDDGWDLFSKIESGPIGAVLIEDCVAFRNGSLLDGSGNGDGNGFKLGGDGIAVPHILRNSVAYANGASGITSNSDPAIIVENCTSYGNTGANINLYGKGDGARTFVAHGNLSMKGGSADVYREMPELASPDNYFWTGAQCANSLGLTLGTDIFVNIDTATMPGRRPNGGIDMKGFLELNAKVPEGVGARIR